MEGVRKIIMPPGKWRSADGQTYVGPTVIEVYASLAQLPCFENFPHKIDIPNENRKANLVKRPHAEVKV